MYELYDEADELLAIFESTNDVSEFIRKVGFPVIVK